MFIRTEHYEELIELLVKKIAVDGQTALSAFLEIMGNYQTTDLDTLTTATDQTASALEFWYPEDKATKQATADLRMITAVLATDGTALRNAGIQRATIQNSVHLWLFSDENPLLEEEVVADCLGSANGGSNDPGC